jgi:hypothetical protein
VSSRVVSSRVVSSRVVSSASLGTDVHGGVYLDVKSVPLTSLSTLFTNASRTADKYTWFATINHDSSHVTNCILASPPRNPVLRAAVEHAVTHVDETNSRGGPFKYYSHVEWLKAAAESEYGVGLGAPATHENDRSRLVLMQEECDQDVQCRVPKRIGGTRPDRYGVCCNAYDELTGLAFQVRDPRYPWGGALSSPFG